MSGQRKIVLPTNVKSPIQFKGVRVLVLLLALLALPILAFSNIDYSNLSLFAQDPYNGEYIVKFTTDGPTADDIAAIKSQSSWTDVSYEKIANKTYIFRSKKESSLNSEVNIDKKINDAKNSVVGAQTADLKTDDRKVVEAAVSKINDEIKSDVKGHQEKIEDKAKNIAIIEPNYLFTAKDFPYDDSFYDKQWSLDNRGQEGGTDDVDIDYAEVADTVKTLNKEVLVAVIDSGIDYTHPDLGGCLGEDCLIVGGFDFVNNDDDPMDDLGHGTLITGVIVAKQNNRLGMTGMCPKCKILSLKFLDSDGLGSYDDVVRALDYAINHDAKVINMSIGSKEDSEIIKNKIHDAVAAGIIVAAAAGNDHSDSNWYPASYDDVASVTGTDRNDNLGNYANFSSTVDLLAPGTDILSTVNDGPYWEATGSFRGVEEAGAKYLRVSGTSIATPYYTALAALLISKYPGLNLNQKTVMAHLIKTADMVTTGEFGEEKPRINVERAFTTPITVIGTNNPEITIDEANLDDSVSATPNGEINPNDVIDVYLKISNKVAKAVNVVGTLTSNNKSDVLVSSINFGDIDAGQTVQKSDHFTIRVKQNAINNDQLVLGIKLTYNGGEMTKSFTYNIKSGSVTPTATPTLTPTPTVAPTPTPTPVASVTPTPVPTPIPTVIPAKVVIDSIELDDAGSSQANKILNPGENVKIYLNLHATTADAANVIANLIVGGNAQATTSIINVGVLKKDVYVRVPIPFGIKVNDDAANGNVVSLDITINHRDGSIGKRYLSTVQAAPNPTPTPTPISTPTPLPNGSTGSRMTDQVIADIDNDGRNDTIVASSWSLIVYSGASDGNFNIKWVYELPNGVNFYTPNNKNTIAIADLDADGKKEILAAALNNGKGQLYVFNSNGTVRPSYPVSFESPIYSPAAANVDFESGDEMFVAEKGNLTMYSIKDNKSNQYKLWTRTFNATGDSTSDITAPTITDVNNDLAKDVVFGVYQNQNISIYRIAALDGKNINGFDYGTAAVPILVKRIELPTSSNSTVKMISPILAVDVDGDGRQNLVLGYNRSTGGRDLFKLHTVDVTSGNDSRGFPVEVDSYSVNIGSNLYALSNFNVNSIGNNREPKIFIKTIKKNLMSYSEYIYGYYGDGAYTVAGFPTSQTIASNNLINNINTPVMFGKDTVFYTLGNNCNVYSKNINSNSPAQVLNMDPYSTSTSPYPGKICIISELTYNPQVVSNGNAQYVIQNSWVNPSSNGIVLPDGVNTTGKVANYFVNSENITPDENQKRFFSDSIDNARTNSLSIWSDYKPSNTCCGPTVLKINLNGTPIKSAKPKLSVYFNKQYTGGFFDVSNTTTTFTYNINKNFQLGDMISLVMDNSTRDDKRTSSINDDTYDFMRSIGILSIYINNNPVYEFKDYSINDIKPGYILNYDRTTKENGTPYTYNQNWGTLNTNAKPPILSGMWDFGLESPKYMPRSMWWNGSVNIMRTR